MTFSSVSNLGSKLKGSLGLKSPLHRLYFQQKSQNSQSCTVLRKSKQRDLKDKARGEVPMEL